MKQIAIANKQSVYADTVIHRKMSDLMLKHEQLTTKEMRIE